MGVYRRRRRAARADGVLTGPAAEPRLLRSRTPAHGPGDDRPTSPSDSDAQLCSSVPVVQFEAAEA
ncbi:MAG: hypothetical protein F9K36_12870 [Burkholderiaceae bacterium]|nr:MAG: hypothetical protein F9K36_12870 [Burkholderiaceae bacterium]